jgi:type IV pilus assembly protein PilY1
MGNGMVKRCAWFSGIVIFSFLVLLCVRSLADDTCLVAFSSPDQGWNTLTAPVIPPEESQSGNEVYMAFFRAKAGPFWEGNVVRFALSADNVVVGKDEKAALEADGRIKAEAVPFWAAKDWADPSKANYIANTDRNIYTYLGSSTDLIDPGNRFGSDNPLLTAEVLGNPTHSPSQIIEFVRGADVFDENGDGNTAENRAAILGDVVHSRPLVVRYLFPDGSSKTMVFFGANDGMLHAVLDSEMDPHGNETLSGTEAWAFIPPDQLHRLKNLLEGIDHDFFIDASPKVFVQDLNGDGVLDAGDGDQAILVCGERTGGTGYFALDITDPQAPRFLWRINQVNDAAILHLPPAAAPDNVIPALGETWSVPAFALVRTADDDETGTPVFFVGGGYTPDNSAGKAILAIKVSDGNVLAKFENDSTGISGMDYAIPSAVTVVDEDDNGFADKVYVGDVGGQLWRIGKFTDEEDNPLPFPESDENVTDWKAHILFFAGIPGETPRVRRFFYPPSVTLEKDYDLLFAGTGDAEDACNRNSLDRIYAIKDASGSDTLTELDLVDITTQPYRVPDLDDETADVDRNGFVDQGWYLPLAPGEKVLAKGLVFNKVYYVTSFTPNPSGGTATLYALNYKTGESAFFETTFPHNPRGGVEIGTSIPSTPVVAVSKAGQKMFISSTQPTPAAERPSRGAQEAGILAIHPTFPSVNFFYLWWKQL